MNTGRKLEIRDLDLDSEGFPLEDPSVKTSETPNRTDVITDKIRTKITVELTTEERHKIQAAACDVSPSFHHRKGLGSESRFDDNQI